MIFCGLLAGIWRAPLYDRRNFTQPFRQPSPVKGVTYEGADAFAKYLIKNTEYLLFRDGPNTSVAIGVSRDEGKEYSRSIFVNGKSDGSTRGDRLTTVMLGHVPALFAKNTEKVCVIGFGTGMTAGVLTLYDEVKRIDLAEISGTILENISAFDGYNHAVSRNPKLRFHEMDAFRLLEGSSEPFDVIISEPSNPWVLGIENLYSDEFYAMAARRLGHNGMFVQWIHSYSFTDSLFRIVLRTLSPHFPYISVFQLRGGDLALVGTRYRLDREDFERAERRFKQPAVYEELLQTGLFSLPALLAYEIIPNEAVTSTIDMTVAPHRLENPLLSNEAAKAFFSGESAGVLQKRRHFNFFFSASKNDSLLARYLGVNQPYPEALVRGFHETFCEHPVSVNPTLCEESILAGAFMSPSVIARERFLNKLSDNAKNLVSYLARSKYEYSAMGLSEFRTHVESFKSFYSPLARMPETVFLRYLDGCARSVSQKEELYGECLLQRILLAETFGMGEKTLDWIAKYEQWFAVLPDSSASYRRLHDAGQILRRIAEHKRR
jgi:spermidine synthase